MIVIAILLTLLTASLIVSFVAYYISVIFSFLDGDFDTKKEFLLALIPYQLWSKSFIKKFNNLK